MTLRELRRADGAAGQLLAKVERIHGLWNSLPSEEDMLTMVNLAERFASALEQGKEIYVSEDFPTADALEPHVEPAVAINRNLKEAKETYVGEDFPTAEALEPDVEAAVALNRNLKEAAETEVPVL